MKAETSTDNFKDISNPMNRELYERNEASQHKAHNLLVELQMNKLGSKISFMEEYEKVLIQERRNQEIFQKLLIAEKVHIAHKRLELLNQEQVDYNTTENKDIATMLNFTSHNDTNVNVDDMISLDHDNKMNEFPKDSF